MTEYFTSSRTVEQTLRKEVSTTTKQTFIQEESLLSSEDCVWFTEHV